MSKFNWIGAVAKDVGLCVVMASTGFRTVEDARRNEIIVAGTGAGSETDTYPVILNEVLKTRFKLITGYLGTKETIMAMESGEAHGRCSFALAAIKRVGAGAPQPPAGQGEQVLRQEALVWFTGEGSEAAHQRPLPLAVFQEGCVFRVAGLAALAQAGIEPVLRFTGHSATGIRHAVATGLAVTPLPRGMAKAKSPPVRVASSMRSITAAPESEFPSPSPATTSAGTM